LATQGNLNHGNFGSHFAWYIPAIYCYTHHVLNGPASLGHLAFLGVDSPLLIGSFPQGHFDLPRTFGSSPGTWLSLAAKHRVEEEAQVPLSLACE